MTESIRDLKIEYGSLSFGDTSTRRIDSSGGKITMERSAEEFRLDFGLLITAASPAALATEIAAVEEGIRKPFQDLKVTAGDGDTRAVMYYFTHDGTGSGASLGFDADATATKSGSEHDTALSRLYRVRIHLGLPQSQLTSNSREGMRNTSVSVAYSPSRRRTITINGEFTAVGTNTAREQYESKIAARASAVLTAIGGAASTWELIDEPNTEVEDTRDGTDEQGGGNVIRFSRTYQELIFAEPGGTDGGAISGGSGVLSNPKFINPELTISTDMRAGLQDQVWRRLEGATVNFSSAIDRDVSTDLESIWLYEIRPFVYTQLASFLPALARAITRESPTYDLYNNSLQVQIQVSGAQTQGLPFEGSIRVSDSYETGMTLVPVWSGIPTEKYAYGGPHIRKRSIAITERYFENDMPGGRANPLPFNRFRAHANGGYTMRESVDHNREVIGKSGETVMYITKTRNIEIEYASQGAGAVGENLDILFEGIGRGGENPVGGLNVPGLGNIGG